MMLYVGDSTLTVVRMPRISSLLSCVESSRLAAEPEIIPASQLRPINDAVSLGKYATRVAVKCYTRLPQNHRGQPRNLWVHRDSQKYTRAQ